MSETIIKALMDAWQAPYVARHEAYLFSGGIVSPKSLANADSEKRGPEGAFRFGKRRVAYPTEALAKWIAKQCTSR